MRYGIPVLGQRVAPRCTIAESLLIVTWCDGRIVGRVTVPLDGSTWAEVLPALADQRIDTLVCGGIDHINRGAVEALGMTIIENVACTSGEVIDAIRMGTLRPEFGFGGEIRVATPGDPPLKRDFLAGGKGLGRVDCLACEDRVCLRGAPCSALQIDVVGENQNELKTLEATRDIALERERTLCRLSELVYFCLEMNYRRIGVAYCQALAGPTRILVSLLRRFFSVYPVWCKIGGRPAPEADSLGATPASPDLIACNPRGQAAALASANTDINVAVGLCMGADCLFARASRVPVTTFIVKDRSLANNPIGALYSDHYLREVARTSHDRTWKP
ncbi:MAG: DUF1847 domain-containing protein [Planctomycetota bacterium]